MRGDAIGGDHELFDQLFRSIGFIGKQIAQDAPAEHRLCFDRFQVERAARAAHGAQRLRHFILGTKLLIHARHSGHPRGRRAGAGKPRAHGVVRQLGAIDDPGAIQIRLHDHTRGIDGHVGNERETFLIFAQRGEIRGKFLGQHGKNRRGRVDRGRIDTGMIVDGRAGLDHGIHIGDRHQNPGRART